MLCPTCFLVLNNRIKLQICEYIIMFIGGQCILTIQLLNSKIKFIGKTHYQAETSLLHMLNTRPYFSGCDKKGSN